MPEDFTRSRLYFADSALKSSPLWNFTPRRSLTSQVVGATSFGSSAASAGTIFRFGSRSTSVSNRWVATMEAGASCWFMVSSVVGSTPWAMTTLPCGAASPRTGAASIEHGEQHGVSTHPGRTVRLSARERGGYFPSLTAMSKPLIRSSPRAFQVMRLVAP